MRTALIFLCGVMFASHWCAATSHAQNIFTVTNTNTSGPGSFSQAITDANSIANFDANTPDVINFDIGGGGVQIIRAAGPTGSFATVLDPVIIDGTNQPGYTGTPLIVFDGSDGAGNALVFDGMQIQSGGSTIRGLVIQGCANNCIDMVFGGNNLVEDNYIGTDITGTIAVGNGGAGVSIGLDSSGNTIRDNLISGSTAAQGIQIQSLSNNNIIEDNLIGTDATGTQELGNAREGIFIGSNDNWVSNNVIAGNGSLGPFSQLSFSGSGNHFSGNLIGTDVTGTAVLGNYHTVAGSGDNVFGVDATGYGEGNVVAGSDQDGIFLNGPGATRIAGNFVGTDRTGQLNLGNQRHGIVLFSSNNTIVNNTIAFNGGTSIANRGIVVIGTGNRIQANSIHSNAGLGIDMGFLGPNPNDDGDPDTGPNNLQNYPILTVVEGGATTRVVGVLNSMPLENFELEFFASSDVDPSGHGEGERFLGSTTVSTDALNQAAFDVTVPGGSSSGEWITATATDANGNTSEFSAALQITNTDPIADAGPDQSLQCDGNGQAFVMLDGTGSFDPDSDTLEYQWSVPAGIVLDDDTLATPSGLFPLGITLATLTVTDGKGGVGVDDVEIVVIDTISPEVACTTDEMALWPPNHQMETVQVFVQATDNCTDPSNLTLVSVTVSSSEPDDDVGSGDGETTGDVQGQDGFSSPIDVTSQFTFNAATGSFDGTISIRAEREGTGSGRSYTITATVLDTSSNLADSSCVVVVPHDRRGRN